jgi:ATP-binding cassette subfamily F protein uup
MALLGDATLRMLPRGIDEYIERRRRMEEAVVPPSAPTAAKEAPAAAAVSPQAARAAKKELQKIERQLDKMSSRETTLHAQIADNATDFEKVAKLDAELRELVAERDELEMRWLELAEDA